MRTYRYGLDRRGRRVLVGLTFEETREFEILDAGLALDAKLFGIADGALPEDLRWFELYNKYQAALLREGELQW